MWRVTSLTGDVRPAGLPRRFVEDDFIIAETERVNAER
jgi:hypothetical protein